MKARRDATEEENKMDSTTYLSRFSKIETTRPNCNVIDVSSLQWETGEIMHEAMLVDLINEMDQVALINLAEAQSACALALTALAFHPSVDVRAAVADNPSAPVGTLMLLAQDESEDVRFQLAENHNIPDRVLNVLADDANPFVAWRAGLTLARKNGQTQRVAA
jgi:hypothetical protein